MNSSSRNSSKLYALRNPCDGRYIPSLGLRDFDVIDAGQYIWEGYAHSSEHAASIASTELSGDRKKNKYFVDPKHIIRLE